MTIENDLTIENDRGLRRRRGSGCIVLPAHNLRTAAEHTSQAPNCATMEEPEPTFEILAAEYEVDAAEPIGLGNFGSVHFAARRSDQKLVAIKAVSKVRTLDAAKRSSQATWEELLAMEVELVAELGAPPHHRNLCRFYGKYEDANFVYLVQQLCTGGELADWLAQQPEYSERLAARVAYDVLQALCACHEKDVVHRDLKPQNLLLTAPDGAALLKLVDFGLAVRRPAGAPPLKEICGTLDYMAPEMLGGAYDEKVDVWAAGVLLYVLLTGRHPFRGPSQSATEARIKEASPALDGPPLDDASPAAVDLVRALLSPTADQRPSAKQALRHAWLRERLNQEARALPSTIPAALQALCAQEHWNGGAAAAATRAAASRDGGAAEGGGGGGTGGGGGGGGGNKAGQLAGRERQGRERALGRDAQEGAPQRAAVGGRRARALAEPADARSGASGGSAHPRGRAAVVGEFHLTVAAASGGGGTGLAAACGGGGAAGERGRRRVGVGGVAAHHGGSFAAHEGCGGRRGDGRERGGGALRRRARSERRRRRAHPARAAKVDGTARVAAEDGTVELRTRLRARL